ncbi:MULTISPECIES: SMI1/KNR4 family protein [unclassified Microcoleus]|uniref:SMI1/KNR4 family protein n=1 Tax=unclassified Microcoleus TaxID=2642155 RepID=UPI002FD336FE
MYLDRVKERFKELKLVNPHELMGCTYREITELEKKLGFSLPEAYKEFLLWMGKNAGRVLQGSDCFFKHLPYLKEWAIELLEENQFPNTLPEDAFVFFMHQGYQFSFFRLSEGDDPPTYFYCEGTNQTSFTRSHNKLSEFMATEIQLQAKYLTAFAS